jgi:hypothetical protein
MDVGGKMVVCGLGSCADDCAGGGAGLGAVVCCHWGCVVGWVEVVGCAGVRRGGGLFVEEFGGATRGAGEGSIDARL